LFFLKRHCDGQQDVGKAGFVPRLKKYISLSDVNQNQENIALLLEDDVGRSKIGLMCC
jgi:hypothetical protein